MADEEEHVENMNRQLANLFYASLRAAFPNEPDDIEPLVAAFTTKFGDYQCNNALGLFTKFKRNGTHYANVHAVGQDIVINLPPSEMIESCSIGGPGFVNVKLSNDWIAKSIQKMLIDGIETWATRLPVKRVVVDFSSPNIAKQMHVGHLRSTIIGDSIARMLEFSNVEVLRRNHVGDWGTQFGMLIEYLFEKFPNVEDVNETAISDLQAFYKESKKRFDTDVAFKERAQKAVVRLQGGESKYRQAWTQICGISRKEFDKTYACLGVHLEEMGESFYNPYIPKVIEALSNQGLIEVNEDARVIFIEGFKIPLIVVKKDGGYNYASTDLAALWYRLNEEKADWIIYVTDVGQQQHFDMGIIAIHWTEEELEQIAEIVGYAAVKYADLKNNRLTNYTFSFKQMLNHKGNTAVALLYAYARICSIIEKSDQNIQELKTVTTSLVLDHVDERMLGLHLMRFSEVVEEACSNLLPSVLCDYFYNLSEYFTKFYLNYQVSGSAEETSRLLLCEATVTVMRKCFHLLGIVPRDKI